jgi:imidazolonepropionase-like amidohydrolase
MRSVTALIGAGLVVSSLAAASAFQGGSARGAVLFEGARLLTGDVGVAIDNSAFVMENGRITRVGRKGEVPLPAGGTRVDLTGKTVMPALIDMHNHIGWTDQRTGIATKTSFDRANVVDHLQRYAYYGIAAALSMGLDRWDKDPDLPYQLRNEIIPNAARFLTVGRGIAATPMAGPVAEYRLGVPYGAQTEAEGIQHVHELRDRKVEMIKIWVDDRQGSVPKLQPNVYRAIINEAHKNNMRVVAHIFNLADAKDLLKANVDGFAHGVRDRDVDDEYMAILKQHPKVWEGPNLPGRALPPEEAAEEITWLSETLPPSQIARMRQQLAARQAGRGRSNNPPSGMPADMFGIQCRNLRRVHDAGMIIGLGTDADRDIGYSVHQELADMVYCGLSPAEAVTAGTKTSASLLKLDQLGTIAAGKSADFIVLNANPLDDIRNTRKIDKVYLRGVEVDRAGLRKSLSTEEARTSTAAAR